MIEPMTEMNIKNMTSQTNKKKNTISAAKGNK